MCRACYLFVLEEVKAMVQVHMQVWLHRRRDETSIRWQDRMYRYESL